MKALYKSAPGAGLEFVDRPEPETGPEDVKIRVLRTGICGTDLHIEQWDDWAASEIRTPLVPGHEFYGEVVEVGELVHDISVGDRVSGEGHIVCGMCRNCRAGRRQMCIRTKGLGLHRDGAFAEFVVLPGENVWVHHSPVEPEVGAIFDPFGNAVHTALAFSLVGEDVLVTGCGPIGLMSIAVARHVGARFIVASDVSPARLELAVATHEVGHLLGLVDLFLRTGRADPEHPGHSANPRSVMYWAVESDVVGDLLTGGPPVDFDADDRADLATIRNG